MFQTDFNQFGDMRIIQAVVQDLAFTPVPDQRQVSQVPELMGDGGLTQLQQGRQITDTHLPFAKRHHDAEAGRVAQRPEGQGQTPHHPCREGVGPGPCNPFRVYHSNSANRVAPFIPFFCWHVMIPYLNICSYIQLATGCQVIPDLKLDFYDEITKRSAKPVFKELPMSPKDPLLNYDHLIAKVDALCARIRQNYGRHMACHKGCAGCCRHISIFPVEAAALARALHHLPREKAAMITAKARTTPTTDACPLLEDDLCLLYRNRPIICRTHGFPMLVVRSGRQSVDFCPLNFTDTTSLPGDAIISLEPLNAALTTINRLFTAEAAASDRADRRFSIAEAILLASDG